MNIFTRRELTSTFDLKRLDQIRAALRAHGIKYYIKTVNRRSSSPFAAGTRGHTGTAFERMELEYDYKVYVNRSDYDMARELI